MKFQFTYLTFIVLIFLSNYNYGQSIQKIDSVAEQNIKKAKYYPDVEFAKSGLICILVFANDSLINVDKIFSTYDVNDFYLEEGLVSILKNKISFFKKYKAVFFINYNINIDGKDDILLLNSKQKRKLKKIKRKYRIVQIGINRELKNRKIP